MNTKIILLLMTLSVIVLTACTQQEIAANECQKEFEECNYECGEGILEEICKEECTQEYEDCRDKLS